jgi:putative DNA primase/helicase
MGMTDTAPETLGLAHCDLPLLLDELDTLDPDPRAAAGRLKTIVQRLCGGQEKTRSHRAPSAGGPANEFRVIFASAAEKRLTDFMREGGRNVTGGLATRLVDVPADAGRGQKIFERLPRDRKTGKRVTADQFTQRLNRACYNSYGVIGRAYLAYLVRELSTNRSALEASLNKDKAAFETKVANDPQVDPRVRRRFAALYAAGQLGLRSKILPPECDGFMDAIASCYRDAVALMPRPALSPAQAINAMNKFLDNNRKRLLKLEGLTRGAFEESIGVRPDQRRHGKRVWLKTSVLPEIFPGDQDSTAKLLADAGIIVRSSGGLIARQQRVPGLGTKEYFYIIDWTKLDVARPKAEVRNKHARR